MQSRKPPRKDAVLDFRMTFPVSVARRRRWAWGALVIVILSIGASEFYLRHLGLGRPALIMPDPAAGYILKPDQDLHRFGNETRINSYGMRSDPVPAIKQANVFRILIVGDSFAYGSTQLDQSQIFAELLHHELPRILHRPVEVFNASAGGWAISNELGYVRSRGVFNADLVLLALNNGDPTQPFNEYSQVGLPSVDNHPDFALQELWERYLKGRIFPGRAQPVNTDTAASDAANATQNLSYLDQFLAVTIAGGSRMAVAYIPLPTHTDPATGLIAWCAANHVPLIDLASAAKQWASIPDIFIVGGGHYNAKGNRLIADELEKDWPVVMPSPQASANESSK